MVEKSERDSIGFFLSFWGNRSKRATTINDFFFLGGGEENHTISSGMFFQDFKHPPRILGFSTFHLNLRKKTPTVRLSTACAPMESASRV